MSIQIELKPEVEAELGRQAAVRGVDVGEYVASLLEDAALSRTARRPLTLQDLDEALGEIGQYSHKIPTLPDEAFRRESLYQDHD